MTEVFGAISGAVGIAVAALHATRALSNLFAGISEAPDGICRLKLELKTLESILESIPGNKSNGVHNRIEEATNLDPFTRCIVICREELNRFTDVLKPLENLEATDKRSKGENEAVLDRDEKVCHGAGYRKCGEVFAVSQAFDTYGNGGSFAKVCWVEAS